MSINSLPPLLAGLLSRIQQTLPSDPITFTTPATAGKEFVVPHNLGRLPNGFNVIYKSAPCDIYDSGRPWTPTVMFLKASAANVEVKIQVV